jgi:hypothetical protein
MATMSAEPGAPAEEPQETDLVTNHALNERLEFFERGLKERLAAERRERLAAQRESIEGEIKRIVDSAIRMFKSELENERIRERSAEDDRKFERWKIQNDLWFNRFISAVAGIVISIVFGSTMSQCSHLDNRISALESKAAKP